MNQNIHTDISSQSTHSQTANAEQHGGTDSTSKSPMPSKKKTLSKRNKNKKATSPPNQREESPEPGPSRVYVPSVSSQPANDNAEEDTPPADEELCCQCKRWSPPGLRNLPGVTQVNWAFCDRCNHWTHLRFCVSVWEVSRDDIFFCPCCAVQV